MNNKIILDLKKLFLLAYHNCSKYLHSVIKSTRHDFKLSVRSIFSSSFNRFSLGEESSESGTVETVDLADKGAWLLAASFFDPGT